MSERSKESRGAKEELQALTKRAQLRGLRSLEDEELERLPLLYRQASTELARLRSQGRRPERAARLQRVVIDAHGLLHRNLGGNPRSPLVRLGEFFLLDVPRAIRMEWRLIMASLGLMYGVALVSGLLVGHDLALAFTLFDPGVVNAEIEQLQGLAEGESFRGNFTFSADESPGAAGYIMGNNLRVAVMFFASALIPPLYLLVVGKNGLMLGSYIGIATHWDQGGAISSILWCHGMLELQAFILAGTSGLILLRAWIAPGIWTRAEALRREGLQAWRLLAPCFPMLFVAGLIEGFVTPHGSYWTRIAVAVLTGLLMVAWFGFSGRAQPAQERAA